MTRLWIAALPLALVACGGIDDNLTTDDQGQEVEIGEGKEDGAAKPLGTYRAMAPSAGDLSTLVLKSDKTFHRETMIYCVTFPCNPPAEDGAYKLTKSGGSTYVRFSVGSVAVDRFQYKIAGKKLSLRKVGGATWFDLERAEDAWCGADGDCDIQGLTAPCSGQWACVDTVCERQCRAASNDCEAAGGDCVALVPGACSGGTLGDASKYSCGGGLGVTCCLPN